MNDESKEASRLVKQVSLSSPMTELRSLPNAVSRGVMTTLHQPRSISHNALHALPDEPEEEDLSITWRSDWVCQGAPWVLEGSRHDK